MIIIKVIFIHSRYSSYRSVPDGGSAEKTTRPYDRPGTPERPSALGPSSLSEKPYSPASSLDRVKQNLYTDTYESSDRYRHTRSRTTSGERDFRSLPVPSAYSEMAKTVPALPERSRGRPVVLICSSFVNVISMFDC